MLPITDMLLTNHNRPGKKLVKLKGIVIHWTANTSKGANAVANRNYFNTTTNNASAHYIVDDKSIIRCMPDDEIAYHVGANSYTKIGNSIQEKINGVRYSPNFFLIGIEMCVNSDGDWNMTYQNTVELAAFLLKKYNLSIENMYRHYDITGKDCPKMMLQPKEWNAFKEKVVKQMNKDWKDIIRETANNPDEWERAINTVINIANAGGNIGDLEIFKYMPELIEKIYNERLKG